MTTLRPVSEMKDSGIEWVGQIPENWKVAKNNRLFQISKSLVGDEWTNTQLLSLTKNGIIKKGINDGGGKQPESFSTYQYVQANDIVLCLFDIDVSAVFSDRSSFNGMISPAYRVMKCEKSILPAYAKWWFDAVNIGRYYLIYTKSLRKTIDSEGFGNISTAIPPLLEQQAIAAYLDSKTAHIDALIDEARASIDEYKQWKASTIYEAVTKGLNPDAEMIYSGIDIIGNMPKAWDKRRLKFLCDVMTGNQDTQNADENGEYSFYVRSPIVQRANVYTYDGEGILMAGDGAGAGRVFHHAFGKYAIHQRVYCFHNFRDINTDYFFYFISELFKKVMDKGSAQSTVPSVRLPMIQDFIFCLPSEEEQLAIVKYLDSRCGQIDELIAEKESLIVDLEAYKKSLVFEVVTGKRKVV